MTKIAAGTILTITAGDLSDYRLYGVFQAKINLDVGALRTEWLSEGGEGGQDAPLDDAFSDYGDQAVDRFYKWLLSTGRVEQIASVELCLSGDDRGLKSAKIVHASSPPAPASWACAVS